jgi:hypothetical protein
MGSILDYHKEHPQYRERQQYLPRKSPKMEWMPEQQHHHDLGGAAEFDCIDRDEIPHHHWRDLN